MASLVGCCRLHAGFSGSQVSAIRRRRATTTTFVSLTVRITAQCQENLGERVWKEYAKAVEKRDLKKALRILETVQRLEESGYSSPPSFREEEFLEPDAESSDAILFESQPSSASSVMLRSRNGDDDFDDSDVLTIPTTPPVDLRDLLDTCLSATDMRLVGQTYNFLQLKGLIPNFGKYKNITSEVSRDVTPEAFLAASGLEASKLSPKKWGITGNSALWLAGSIVGFNVLVNNGIDVRPFLVSVLTFGLLDAIYLGGTGLASILMSWPPYKRRVFVHEAGHVLVAYFLGCPVRGVILDPVRAMQLGIQGQAGTQFWDATLEEELRQGRLTSASFDRYSMVLFAGIAAEAVVYGEAEGGENDENLFKAIVSVLTPPLSVAQVSNQARWAVLQSFKLLRNHRKALDTVARSLYEGRNLGTVIRDLEGVLLDP